MNATPGADRVRLAGAPGEIGKTWGRLNRDSIHHDMSAFFLEPARQAGLNEGDLIERAKYYKEIVEQTATHWIEESDAIANTAGVDPDLYLAYAGGVYRNLFLGPECTSYAVHRGHTREGAILFHKTRDNADKAQCAFVMSAHVPGVNRFIATSDASVPACMMMVNEKGLAGSADCPAGLAPAAAPPRYRGMMNTQLLRHIAERAEDCDSALEILRDFVARGRYAGGDKNGTHWLFVDRAGTILEVSNNSAETLFRKHTDKVYFSRLPESPAAQRLREAKDPVDFALFHAVSRDASIRLGSSISGMTVEIAPDRPEALSCAWITLPARSVAFPLFMGQEGAPLCLFDGTAYRLGKATGDRRVLWERLEAALHVSRRHVERSVMTDGDPTNPRARDVLEEWSAEQADMLLSVLRALPETAG